MADQYSGQGSGGPGAGQDPHYMPTQAAGFQAVPPQGQSPYPQQPNPYPQQGPYPHPQQGPYPQQPHGGPAGPGGPYGGGPQGPMPGRPAHDPARTKRLALVIVAVVAVAIGAGIWALNALGPKSDADAADESPTAGDFGIGGEHKAAWSKKPLPRPGDTGTMNGLWESQGLIAHISPGGVAVYRAGTGSRVGDVTVPAGAEICGISPTAENGVGGVMLQPRGETGCTQVAAVDLTRAKLLWQKTFKERASDDGAMDGNIAVTKNGLVVAASTHLVAAIPVKGGDPVWRTKPRPQKYADANVNSLAVSGSSVAISYGPDPLASPREAAGQSQVTLNSLKDGGVKAAALLPPTSKTDTGPTVVSADPLVISQDSKTDENASEFLAAKKSGGWTKLDTSSVGTHLADTVVPVPGALVVAGDNKSGSKDGVRVSAINIATGKPLWTRKLGNKTQYLEFDPRLDHGAVRAAVSSAGQPKVQLYAFPVKTGETVRGGALTSKDPVASGDTGRSLESGWVVVSGDTAAILDSVSSSSAEAFRGSAD